MNTTTAARLAEAIAVAVRAGDRKAMVAKLKAIGWRPPVSDRADTKEIVAIRRHATVRATAIPAAAVHSPRAELPFQPASHHLAVAAANHADHQIQRSRRTELVAQQQPSLTVEVGMLRLHTRAPELKAGTGGPRAASSRGKGGGRTGQESGEDGDPAGEARARPHRDAQLQASQVLSSFPTEGNA